MSSPALVAALRRVDALRLFEVEHIDLSFVPQGRVKALARCLGVQAVTRYTPTAHNQAQSLLGLGEYRDIF